MNNTHLVLNRKLGQSFRLFIEDSNGSETVVDIALHKKKGRIGIRAPKDVKVLRQELFNPAFISNPEALNH